MTSVNPMPWPASRAFETISGANRNKATFGRDIATTENHIASRAAPNFGHMRQIRYKATNGQFNKANWMGDSKIIFVKM